MLASNKFDETAKQLNEVFIIYVIMFGFRTFLAFKK